jgi:nicotinamidase-related amidase
MSYHDLLTPDNSAIIFIDHQPQMSFGVANIDRQTLINNTVGLAKAAKIFNVPVILTTVETKSFSGNMWPQLLDLFPGQIPIERSSMNSWEDAKFVAEVERLGRKKLVIAALWTEVCLTFPALQAMGAGPVTWQQVLLEYQRDWARKETYNAVMDLVKEHSGAYGIGVEYAYTMVHGQPASKIPSPATT